MGYRSTLQRPLEGCLLRNSQNPMKKCNHPVSLGIRFEKSYGQEAQHKPAKSTAQPRDLQYPSVRSLSDSEF